MRKSNSFPKTRAEMGDLSRTWGLNGANMADHGLALQDFTWLLFFSLLTTSRLTLPPFLIV